jgi:prophage regulatory protein
VAVEILRFPELQKVVGLSRCSIWRLENARKFPARVQLSSNSVGWRSDEVAAWIEARARGALAAPTASKD